MQKDMKMDNQFDNYELGNDELKSLLSSKDIDDAEKEELIKAFTAELAANPFGDVSEEDCHLLFSTVSIKYTDKKLTTLMTRQNPTVYDDNQALSCCERLRGFIDFFASSGHTLPPITNKNPEACKASIQKRRENTSALKALTENDRRIHELLLQVEKYPETGTCNKILDDLERLRNQINNCKTSGITLPRLFCDNPKEITKTVKKLISIAEKRDNLYLTMKSVDEKITQQDISGNYNKQFIETTISLCEQQNGYINQCVLNDYPVPDLINKQPSVLIVKNKHYINMVDLDGKISSELSDAKTIMRYSVIADDCDKQAKSIKKCVNEKWKIPPLVNENPEQLKKTVQSEIDALKRKKNFKLVIAGVALLVALVLTLVITITVKSREGKSAFPFDPEYAKGQNIESVQKSLSDAGFTNIIPVSDKTGWDKDNTVLGISESYEKGTYYDSDKEIHIMFSCKGRKEVSDILKNWQTRKYGEIVSALKAAGFTDISIKKTGILNTSQTDMTAGLMLNGIEYHNGECYIPTSAPITVSYYVYQISIGDNSESFIGKDYKTVEKNLKDSGFNDVRTEEIKSGWAKDNTVVKLTVNGEEDYESNSTYNPNAKIVVQYSSSGRINATSCFSDWQNTNYQKVKSNLDKAGFTNVKMIEKITDVPENDELISKITINNSAFSGGECYIQKDAPIYIDYNICKLKIGISSSEIKDKNYSDLAAELRQKGFSNIKIKRADDMYHGFLGFGDWFGSWGTTEGNVKEFSIGGKTDFSENDSFDFDDEIIITVHTYEDESYEGIDDNS